MAIDIFFYCKLDVDEFDRSIKKIIFDWPGTFSHAFLFSSVKKMDEVDQEISADFGFVGGQSIVLLRLNDKSFADRLLDMVDIVKSYFEMDLLLALRDGERKM